MSYDSLISLDNEYFNLDEYSLSENEYIFLLSCKEGNLDLIEWILYNDINLNFSIHNFLPFYLVCANNYLNIAKYIYEKNKIINIDEYFFDIIRMFCEVNNFEFIEWFYTIMHDKFQNLSYLKLYNLFTTACENMNLYIAEWLFCVIPSIPIYLYNNKLFLSACQNNLIELAQLLQNMRPKGYYVSIYNYDIIHYEIIKTLVIENSINENELTNHEKCQICYESSNVYTDCKHFFCFDCLERHYEVNNYNCPYCRKINYEDKLFNIII